MSDQHVDWLTAQIMTSLTGDESGAQAPVAESANERGLVEAETGGATEETQADPSQESGKASSEEKTDKRAGERQLEAALKEWQSKFDELNNAVTSLGGIESVQGRLKILSALADGESPDIDQFATLVRETYGEGLLETIESRVLDTHRQRLREETEREILKEKLGIDYWPTKAELEAIKAAIVEGTFLEESEVHQLEKEARQRQAEIDRKARELEEREREIQDRDRASQSQAAKAALERDFLSFTENIGTVIEGAFKNVGLEVLPTDSPEMTAAKDVLSLGILQSVKSDPQMQALLQKASDFIQKKQAPRAKALIPEIQRVAGVKISELYRTVSGFTGAEVRPKTTVRQEVKANGGSTQPSTADDGLLQQVQKAMAEYVLRR